MKVEVINDENADPSKANGTAIPSDPTAPTGDAASTEADGDDVVFVGVSLREQPWRTDICVGSLVDAKDKANVWFQVSIAYFLLLSL